MSEPSEIEIALRKLETKHRVEDFLKKIGATDEAASLLSTHPDTAKLFTWNGVNLTFGKSDLPAVDDPAAREHFLAGPFGRLFTPADDGKDKSRDNGPQLNPALVEAARAGNLTAKGRLLNSLKGDTDALNRALAGERNSNNDAASGHDKTTPTEFDGSKNPFLKLRKPDGTIDRAVEAKIGGMVRAMGHKKVSDIARAAKSPAAPLGLSITGVPLRA